VTFDQDEMVQALGRLVEAESFSTDHRATEACAAVIEDLCRRWLGTGPERIGRHLRWRRPGHRPVLLLCHFDTVWPTGTLADFPFTVEDGIARGPGAFDMKAGIVQGLSALRTSGAGPVTVLLTADEEIGSPSSRSLIEAEASGARAVLVLEPADGPAVKVARKGVGDWTVRVRGRAAHAGLAPETGVNAIVELARQILAVTEVASPEEGTTVNVGTVRGGSANNVVAEEARATVDARVWTDEEADRVAASMASLRATTPGAEVSVEGRFNRGPLEREVSEELYRRLRGLGFDVPAAAVGGASDGNLTGALGVPTLDGLGAVGGGAHARDEHVVVAEMPRRAEMLARLLEDLLAAA
jgi:glutamate carboxypeptidase